MSKEMDDFEKARKAYLEHAKNIEKHLIEQATDAIKKLNEFAKEGEYTLRKGLFTVDLKSGEVVKKAEGVKKKKKLKGLP